MSFCEMAESQVGGNRVFRDREQDNFWEIHGAARVQQILNM